MEHFAGYGFNKSHSAAYAWLAYQTAYLKAHYPADFMAALLTSERANTDKMVQYIGECREMGIRVLPPDVNQSDMFFSVIPDPLVTQVGNRGDSGPGLPESPAEGSPRGLPGRHGEPRAGGTASERGAEREGSATDQIPSRPDATDGARDETSASASPPSRTSARARWRRCSRCGRRAAPSARSSTCATGWTCAR